MRFGLPRSLSPSPARRQAPRRRSAFGIPQSHSDSESSDTESDSGESSSSGSLGYGSQNEFPLRPNQKRLGKSTQSAEDQYFMEDTIASIRLRVKYKDAYEEWEDRARKDAFVAARSQQSLNKSTLSRSQNQSQSHESSRLAELHNKQMDEVQAQLSNFKLVQEQTDKGMREKWDKRSSAVWAAVDKVILVAEERVRKKLEAEEARRRAEEAARMKALQEKREKEERERKEQEEKRKEQEREAEMLRNQREQEAKEREQEEERRKLGLSTALQDWQRARETLKRVKGTPMRIVKGDKELRSAWSAARRQLVTKVGQLNVDAQRNAKISQEIIAIVAPARQFEHIYFALLSSLAKAILLQAEVEVTAEKRTAVNLAQLSVALLAQLEGFADVFWAKLVQRTGGWAIPTIIPGQDVDGSDLEKDKEKRRKVMGYIDGDETNETNADYTARVVGILRVYFHILMGPHPRPLDPIFGTSRYWTYLARMIKQTQLLGSGVASELLFAALEIGGVQARQIWGVQWVKLLNLLYGGTTTGIRGSGEHLIGGTTPEGIAARVRVQLEIERIMAHPPT